MIDIRSSLQPALPGPAKRVRAFFILFLIFGFRGFPVSVHSGDYIVVLTGARGWSSTKLSPDSHEGEKGLEV